MLTNYGKYVNNSSHDGSHAPLVPLVHAGRVIKESRQPFMIVKLHSPMKSTSSIAINFVDVDRLVVEQQLHHIVVAIV